MDCLVFHSIVRDCLFMAAIAWPSGGADRLLPVRIRAGERERCGPVAAGPRRHSRMGNHDHGHVPSRRMDAYRRQHALPVDFRRQCRGFDGPGAVRDLLPSMRRRGGLRAVHYRSRLDDADGWRFGRHRGHSRRLSDPAPACRGADIPADHYLCAVHQPAGLACAWRLDRRPVCRRSQRAGRRRRRRRLFRAYWRLYRGHVPRALFQAQ